MSPNRTPPPSRRTISLGFSDPPVQEGLHILVRQSFTISAPVARLREALEAGGRRGYAPAGIDR